MKEDLESIIHARVISFCEVTGVSLPEGETSEQIAFFVRNQLKQFSKSNYSRSDLVWQLLVLLSGSYPLSADIEVLTNELKTHHPVDHLRVALSACSKVLARTSGQTSEIKIVKNPVLYYCDVSAKTDHNTGIQRVVRNVAHHWTKSQKDFLPVVWDESRNGLASLSKQELNRLSNWSQKSSSNQTEHIYHQPLIIPIGGTFVLAEVPQRSVSPFLTALSKYSGMQTSIIGYDLIPLTSSEFVPAGETEKTLSFLEIVKNSNRVIAISEAAKDEFDGFNQMLSSQGINPVDTLSIALPIDKYAEDDSKEKLAVSQQQRPLILSFGSIEPRKNQLATLMASKLCWQSGLEFELVFVGAGSSRYSAQLSKQIKRLRRSGYLVSLRQSVSDNELSDLLQRSFATVFTSIHEGYGLPISESIAFGKPVLTSNYGSMIEVAKNGRHIAVDPRDISSISHGISSLFNSENIVAPQKATQTHTSWDLYSQDLWEKIS